MTLSRRVKVNGMNEHDEQSECAEQGPLALRQRIAARVTGLIAEVLDIGQVAERDQFLALGGDSLHAARVVACINDEFTGRLPLVALLKAPNLAAFCDLVFEQCGGEREDGVV